jgi:hypothetical protein
LPITPTLALTFSMAFAAFSFHAFHAIADAAITMPPLRCITILLPRRHCRHYAIIAADFRRRQPLLPR